MANENRNPGQQGGQSQRDQQQAQNDKSRDQQKGSPGKQDQQHNRDQQQGGSDKRRDEQQR